MGHTLTLPYPPPPGSRPEGATERPPALNTWAASCWDRDARGDTPRRCPRSLSRAARSPRCHPRARRRGSATNGFQIIAMEVPPAWYWPQTKVLPTVTHHFPGPRRYAGTASPENDLYWRTRMTYLPAAFAFLQVCIHRRETGRSRPCCLHRSSTDRSSPRRGTGPPTNR